MASVGLKRMFSLGLALIAGITANGAAAQDAEKNKKLDEATAKVFNAWLADNHIADGAMVVMRAGEVVGRAERGQRKTDVPVTVASLTKAITGACVAQLIDAGKLQLGDKLADVIKQDLAALPPRQDPRFDAMTIADLLRNRSGLAPSADYTQGNLSTYLSRYSKNQKNSAAQIDQVTRFELASDPGSTYHYANINWLLLGVVVERVTGEPYEDYCHKAVLKPINLPVTGLSPDWPMLMSYGGWHISAQDYAKFASQLAQSVAARKGPVNEWLLKLGAEAGGKAFYALGTNMRIGPRGRTIFHSGSWAVKARGVDGSLEASFGSYFASFDFGVTYAVNYSKSMSGKPLADLDVQMFQAIRDALQ